MTPTINVNLRSCGCGPKTHTGEVHGGHWPNCGGTPIPIPCPIQRTVEMTVGAGECQCWMPAGHRSTCPARPIRVTCSIGGETWADSFVEFVERADGECIGAAFDRVDTVCRERWALIKALVTGAPLSPTYTLSPTAASLVAQRDAVFAALATLAREEEAHAAAYSAAWATLGRPKAMNMEGRTSATILGEHVERLIEQVMSIERGV